MYGPVTSSVVTDLEADLMLLHESQQRERKQRERLRRQSQGLRRADSTSRPRSRGRVGGPGIGKVVASPAGVKKIVPLESARLSGPAAANILETARLNTQRSVGTPGRTARAKESPAHMPPGVGGGGGVGPASTAGDGKRSGASLSSVRELPRVDSEPAAVGSVHDGDSSVSSVDSTAPPRADPMPPSGAFVLTVDGMVLGSVPPGAASRSGEDRGAREPASSRRRRASMTAHLGASDESDHHSDSSGAEAADELREWWKHHGDKELSAKAELQRQQELLARKKEAQVAALHQVMAVGAAVGMSVRPDTRWVVLVGVYEQARENKAAQQRAAEARKRADNERRMKVRCFVAAVCHGSAVIRHAHIYPLPAHE